MVFQKPPDDSLVGARILVGGGVLAVFAWCCRNIHKNRSAYSSVMPTTHAVSGTRWCDNNEDQGGSSNTRRTRLALFRGCNCLYQLMIFFIWASGTIKQGIGMCGGWEMCGGLIGLLGYSPVLFAHNTTLTYIMQTVWWGLATGVCILAAFSGGSLSSAGDGSPSRVRQGPPRVLRRMVHVLFTLILPEAILTSFFEWAVILPYMIMKLGTGASELNYISYSMHAINTLCLLGDFYADRMLLHPAALPILMLWVCVYVANAWFQQAMYGGWPYFFMSLNSYASIFWHTLIFALHYVAFRVVQGLSNKKAERYPVLLRGVLGEAADASVAQGAKRAPHEADGLMPAKQAQSAAPDV